MIKREDNWKSEILDFLKNTLTGRIKQHFDDLVDQIHDAIVVTQKKVIRSMFSTALMVLGIVFLLVGGTFYLTDVLKYSRSMIFLTIGFVLFLIAVILAQSAKLLKYDFKK